MKGAVGGSAELAERLGVTPAAVGHWASAILGVRPGHGSWHEDLVSDRVLVRKLAARAALSGSTHFCCGCLHDFGSRLAPLVAGVDRALERCRGRDEWVYVAGDTIETAYDERELAQLVCRRGDRRARVLWVGG